MKLRKLELKDMPGMLEWMHDEDINQYFQADFGHISEEAVRDFIINAQNDESNYNFAIIDSHDDYLGTISLKHVDREAKNAEYAISTGKKAHGTGCAKIATDEILKYAFEELKLERVYLNVLSKNIRANKFYQKYGFIYEGEFKKHICIRGEFCDLKWYRMLKEEFKG